MLWFCYRACVISVSISIRWSISPKPRTFFSLPAFPNAPLFWISSEAPQAAWFVWCKLNFRKMLAFLYWPSSQGIITGAWFAKAVPLKFWLMVPAGSWAGPRGMKRVCPDLTFFPPGTLRIWEVHCMNWENRKEDQAKMIWDRPSELCLPFRLATRFSPLSVP